MDEIRREAAQHVAELQSSIRWRHFLLIFLHPLQLCRLAFVNKHWRDTVCIGGAIMSIDILGRARWMDAVRGRHTLWGLRPLRMLGGHLYDTLAQP